MASIATAEGILGLSSATMTPFLFQTKTLSSARWTRATTLRPRSRNLISKRCFAGSAVPHVDIAERNAPTPRDALDDSIRIKIRRTPYVHGSEPKFSGNAYGPQDHSHKSEEKRNGFRRAVPVKPLRRNTSRPWDTVKGEDEIVEDEEFEDYAPNVTRRVIPRQHRRTTISASEREAFESIFRNLYEKMKHAQRYDGFLQDALEVAASHKNARSATPSGSQSPETTTRRKAQTSIEDIMGNALAEDLARTRDERKIIVSRYPPSLQALAAKAVGLDIDGGLYEVNTKQKEEWLGSDQLEELRRPIREAVEAKMRAAETDVELWEVMVQEVFSMIGKLGLEEKEKKETSSTKRTKISKTPPKSPRTLATKRSRLVLPPEDQQIVHFEPIFHEGQIISPLALHGPLYPSYLLLAVRLLDRSFAKPSTLTLSILPRIKSLGPISHVLGASTQLYNELLIISWFRNDDFRGANTLLSDMEQSGLNFDKETLEIVEDIRRVQKRTRRGGRGETLQALWGLPEFAPGEFEYWSEKIKTSLKEKEQGRLAY